MESARHRREIFKSQNLDKSASSVSSSDDINPTSQSQLNLIMDSTPEIGKPIPHLPPFASQYRDLMLHQIATVSKATEIKKPIKRRPNNQHKIKPIAAKAAETSMNWALGTGYDQITYQMPHQNFNFDGHNNFDYSKFVYN